MWPAGVCQEWKGAGHCLSVGLLKRYHYHKRLSGCKISTENSYERLRLTQVENRGRLHEWQVTRVAKCGITSDPPISTKSQISLYTILKLFPVKVKLPSLQAPISYSLSCKQREQRNHVPLPLQLSVKYQREPIFLIRTYMSVRQPFSFLSRR